MRTSSIIHMSAVLRYSGYGMNPLSTRNPLPLASSNSSGVAWAAAIGRSRKWVGASVIRYLTPTRPVLIRILIRVPGLAYTTVARATLPCIWLWLAT